MTPKILDTMELNAFNAVQYAVQKKVVCYYAETGQYFLWKKALTQLDVIYNMRLASNHLSHKLMESYNFNLMKEIHYNTLLYEN